MFERGTLLTIEQELPSYTRLGQAFEVGNQVQLVDIAKPYVREVTDWLEGGEAIQHLFLHSDKDFQSIYYCVPNFGGDTRNVMVADRCSKIFSRSILKIERLFQIQEQAYCILEGHLLVILSAKPQAVELIDRAKTQGEKEIYRKDLSWLSDIHGVYQNYLEYELLMEQELMSMIYTTYYCGYLAVIRKKWNLETE
ncbi:MAG TPA: hypothetical protein DCE41_24320 [Cytophagales bacterium]|nr:hypothetical protein [Cytophagales bacterium]HAA17779.1 hypothetical protein [Cytophagales bacterium]HAP59845.1 hypothetical protein [Cytophagales bacterium]